MNKELKATAKQIYNLLESDRVTEHLEDFPKSYIVIPRKNIDEMPVEWQGLFIDLLDYLPTLKDTYSVRERGDNGKFIAGEG